MRAAQEALLGGKARAEPFEKDQIEMQNVDLIVTGGRLYTMDEAATVYPNGALAITGQDIAAVGDASDIAKRFTATQTIDASGQMIMPGFIDTHFHPVLNLRTPGKTAAEGSFSFRSKSQNTLEKKLWDQSEMPSPMSHASDAPHGANLIPFFAQTMMLDKIPPVITYSIARHALLSGLRSGVTSFVEGGSSAVEGVAEAAIALGMRGGVAYTAFDLIGDFGKPEGPLNRIHEVDDVLAAAKDAATRWDGAGDGLLSGWCNIIIDAAASDELIKGMVEIARDGDFPIASHSAATFSNNSYAETHFGETSIKRLDRLGVLDQHWLSAHTGFYTDDELPLLAEKNAHIAHCPGTSNLNGKGILRDGRIIGAMQAGVCVGLATDTVNAGTMVNEIQRAFAGHKEALGDNRVLPAYKVMEMATCDAAEAAGLKGVTGSLAPGLKADLILIDTQRLDYEIREPLETFVVTGQPFDVKTSIINGQVVMRDRELVVADEEEIRRDYRASIVAIGLLAG